MFQVPLSRVYLYILTPCVWNPEVQCRIHKGSPIIHILSRINPIPRIDTYLFKVHSNILDLGLPKGIFPVGLPVKMLKMRGSLERKYNVRF